MSFRDCTIKAAVSSQQLALSCALSLSHPSRHPERSEIASATERSRRTPVSQTTVSLALS
jgi:hypothetical protein